MIFISKLMIISCVIYLVKVFLYPYYRPVSNKHKKRTRSHQKQLKKEKQAAKMKAIKRRIGKKYIVYLLSEAERKRLKKMLERLDKDMTPEEVRLNQFLYAGMAIAFSIFAFKVNTMLGYACLILVVLGWLYPVDELEKTIELKNKYIANDFPAFYSMVYYQYSKTVNIFFADVIRDYLPNANIYMAEELGFMLDNIDFGEEFVLKQLKKRVPLHYIIKFCDIMETRLKGYDNVSQMAYLKNELDEFRVRELEDELEKREKSNAKIQLVLIIVLGIYIFVYYLFTIMESMTMFQ